MKEFIFAWFLFVLNLDSMNKRNYKATYPHGLFGLYW